MGAPGQGPSRARVGVETVGCHRGSVPLALTAVTDEESDDPRSLEELIGDGERLLSDRQNQQLSDHEVAQVIVWARSMLAAAAARDRRDIVAKAQAVIDNLSGTQRRHEETHQHLRDVVRSLSE